MLKGKSESGVGMLDDALDSGGVDVSLRHEKPIPVLHLRKDVLLDGPARRVGYHLVNSTARLLPALVIYGGTAGLLVCAINSYRWGVLLSLTLYSCYMLHLCFAFMVFSAVGLAKVWMSAREHWHARYRDERGLRDQQGPRAFSTSGCRDGDIDWFTVRHVVMLPSYKTPVEMLEATLQALRNFSMAKTNLGVCLALEERESGCAEKAAALRERHADEFMFFMSTFHPPDLPDHVPGKSSNECWAFQQVKRELEDVHGISTSDPGVVITVIDDDSELHENYFEALTYYFLTEPQCSRYTTTWQPPICHFKNYMRQPILVRISSLFATLSELASLANPLDCHVNYSSYSLSLVLASTVGGWDPDYLAEDWHMFAKCSLMTGGRVRCKPIFLPLLNYTPEEDTYCGTMVSRWTQAKRHALGVGELVYVMSSMYLGALEVESWRHKLLYLYRLSPLLGKFAQVHFVNGMSAAMNILAQLVIHFYMWRSWCYMSSPAVADSTCVLAHASETDYAIADEQIVLNSWLVYWQQRVTAATAVCSVLSGGFGAIYFRLVQDRVEGEVDAHFLFRNPLLHWIGVEVQISCVGLLSSFIYGSLPLWIAVLRIVWQGRFSHVVAGMVGRKADADV